jgi:hypothetical protein
VVFDANGCDYLTTVNISSTPGYTATITPDHYVVGANAPVQLTLSTTPAQTIVSATWEPYALIDLSGCADPLNCNTVIGYPGDHDTTFSVSVLSNIGCPAHASVTIHVDRVHKVFVPTVFSPNGDGKNETFDFQILGAESVAVTVYDRWGEKVYENTAQHNGEGQGWNGLYNGQPAMMGTYSYQFIVKYYDGTASTEAGDVTLIR